MLHQYALAQYYYVGQWIESCTHLKLGDVKDFDETSTELVDVMATIQKW